MQWYGNFIKGSSLQGSTTKTAHELSLVQQFLESVSDYVFLDASLKLFSSLRPLSRLESSHCVLEILQEVSPQMITNLQQQFHGQ